MRSFDMPVRQAHRLLRMSGGEPTTPLPEEGLNPDLIRGKAHLEGPTQQFSYFQLRRLPCASHSTVWVSLFARVSGRFASVTHSTYSRRHEGGKASKVAAAFGSESSAMRRSSGVASSGLGGFFGRGFGPAAATDAARAISAFSSGS